MHPFYALWEGSQSVADLISRNKMNHHFRLRKADWSEKISFFHPPKIAACRLAITPKFNAPPKRQTPLAVILKDIDGVLKMNTD
jgi:hypothetical protein